MSSTIATTQIWGSKGTYKQSHKNWYNNNKQAKIEKSKSYYKANRDSILAKRRIKYQRDKAAAKLAAVNNSK